MANNNNNLGERIAQKASNAAVAKQDTGVKLTKNMSIAEMVKAMEPEIKRALPSVLTPERFTRMVLSALNNTPSLAQCTPMSFLAAMMSCCQLALEPNTSLGQAYLIPYKNHGQMECQFQIGYRGLLDLAYRNERMQSIEAHTVYENDVFSFEYGLQPKLKHIPTMNERGEIIAFYAVFRLDNGGYQFEVMSKSDIERYASTYSKAYASDYSPWKNAFEQMAKKVAIKKVLKYAPIKADFRKALSMDESIKTELSVDMSEVKNEEVEYIDVPYGEGFEAAS